MIEKMIKTGGQDVSGIRTVEGGFIFLTFTKVVSYVSTCGRICTRNSVQGYSDTKTTLNAHKPRPYIKT